MASWRSGDLFMDLYWPFTTTPWCFRGDDVWYLLVEVLWWLTSRPLPRSYSMLLSMLFFLVMLSQTHWDTPVCLCQRTHLHGAPIGRLWKHSASTMIPWPPCGAFTVVYTLSRSFHGFPWRFLHGPITRWFYDALHGASCTPKALPWCLYGGFTDSDGILPRIVVKLWFPSRFHGAGMAMPWGFNEISIHSYSISTVAYSTIGVHARFPEVPRFGGLTGD